MIYRQMYVLEKHLTPSDSGNLANVSKEINERDFRPCGIRFEVDDSNRNRIYCASNWGFRQQPLLLLGTDSGATKSRLLCLLCDLREWNALNSDHYIGQRGLKKYISFQLNNHVRVNGMTPLVKMTNEELSFHKSRLCLECND
jgi:hypothetical protein